MIWKYFLQVCHLYFHFQNDVFEVQKLILIKSYLSIFSCMDSYFGIITKNYLPMLGHKYFLLLFFLEILKIFEVFTFRSLILFFWGGTPMACGGSQAKGLIRAAATSLYHSHRNGGIPAVSATYNTAHGNTRSLTRWARPGIEPTTSLFLVRFVSHWATMGTPHLFLYVKGKYKILVVLSLNSWPINDIQLWEYIKKIVFVWNESFVFEMECFFKLKILFRASKLVCINIFISELIITCFWQYGWTSHYIFN